MNTASADPQPGGDSGLGPAEDARCGQEPRGSLRVNSAQGPVRLFPVPDLC